MTTMMMMRVVLLLAMGWALLGGLPAGEAAPLVSEVAEATERPEAAPKYSDVCFSTRWPRPRNDKDPIDAIAIARQFHATRFEWLYVSGRPDYVAKLRDLGFSVAGTVNTTLPDGPRTGTYQQGRAVDLNGELIVAPWMAVWKSYWGCFNRPEYRRIYLEAAKLDVDAGVDTLQMDGSGGNTHLPAWGGCFCEDCVAGFRTFLAANATDAQRAGWAIGDLAEFDYAKYLRDAGTEAGKPVQVWKGAPELRALFEEFQAESTLQFYVDTHASIDEHAGRKMVYSHNSAADWLPYNEQFDYRVAETYPWREGVPQLLYQQRIVPARELQNPFIFTYVTRELEATRKFIAMSYAMGSHVIVPWDVYINSDDPRHFGKAEEYADLYGFVRANASLFDGYEEAAVTGPDLPDERYGDEPPVNLIANSDVYAVARAKPGDRDAPVVIHLLDWQQSDGFTVSLNPGALFGDRPFSIELVTPAKYDAEVHARAEGSGDFSGLVDTITLARSPQTTVRVPGLKPWGMLVLRPVDGDAPDVWPPTLQVDHTSTFMGAVKLRLLAPAAGSTVRYTTDGSEPTRQSPVADGPVEVSEAAEIRARAFTEAAASSPVALRIDANKDVPAPMPPDDASVADSLKLWLSAAALGEHIGDGDAVEAWHANFGPSPTVPRATLHGGGQATAPVFVAEALGGQPVVRFDGETNMLAVPGFANDHLAGKGFTFILVSQSDDGQFGVSGNALNGSGGVPRLYVTREMLIFDDLRQRLPNHAAGGAPNIVTYTYDGLAVGNAFVDTRPAPAGTLHDMAPVAQFGGGNLSIPFCSGGVNRAGDLAELIIYDRALTDSERTAVEIGLAQNYGIKAVRRWNLSAP